MRIGGLPVRISGDRGGERGVRIPGDRGGEGMTTSARRPALVPGTCAGGVRARGGAAGEDTGGGEG